MKLTAELAKIDERNGVKDEHLGGPDLIKRYVETQLSEQMTILTRLRIDVLLNERVSVDGKKERQARDDKIKALENDITQFAETIAVLQQLHNELN